MKILVVGASRGTGLFTVKEALARGHEVSALARNIESLPDHPSLHELRGNALDTGDVTAAVRGQDAVIVALGASPLAMRKPLTLYSESTRLVIAAMKEHGVRRLVVLSARGAGDSAQLFNPVQRLVVRHVLLRHNYDDHERQEQLAKESGLEWVIARPTRLTNGPAKRRFKAESEQRAVPSSISRADSAVFMVDAVEDDRWVRKTVLLGG
jgi:putative NADH-flavin reductase